MEAMLSGPSVFNGNIAEWDLSKVTDVTRMFTECVRLNGDLSTWVPVKLDGEPQP